MKSLSFLFTLLISCNLAIAQRFKEYSNGLIYSDETMKQLAVMIDSLNKQFQQLPSSKTYYSKSQARVHSIRLDGNDAVAAQLDMENQMPFEEFIQKYPKAQIDRDMLIVRSYSKNHRNEDKVEFKSCSGEQVLDFSGDLSAYARPLKDQWTFDAGTTATHWGDGRREETKVIREFYFVTEIESRPIPQKYARSIHYADYLIDTAGIFRPNATKDRGYSPKEGSKIKQFNDYVYAEFDRVDPESKIRNKSVFGSTPEWQDLKSATDDKMAKRPDFNSLLKEAVVEVLEKGGSNDHFESYVARYYSKEIALELKRRRRVVGLCSEDRAPLNHAQEIALLAAETANRQIFLRAHLNVIVNELVLRDYYFAKSNPETDYPNSKKRATNIWELEELNIDVASLLQGIFLEMENPDQNHYQGNIYQVQNAFAGMKNSEQLEQKLLAMLRDEQLDDYNRMQIYELLRAYNHFFNDPTRLDSNGELLKAAKETLPEYLRNQLK